MAAHCCIALLALLAAGCTDIAIACATDIGMPGTSGRTAMLSMCYCQLICVLSPWGVDTASTHAYSAQKQRVLMVAAGCFCCECSKLRSTSTLLYSSCQFLLKLQQLQQRAHCATAHVPLAHLAAAVTWHQGVEGANPSTSISLPCLENMFIASNTCYLR